MIKKYKQNISVLVFSFLIFSNINYKTNAVIEYNFTKKEFVWEDNKKNFNKNENEDVNDVKEDVNQIKLKIGGLSDFRYISVGQSSDYKNSVLPNGLKGNPAVINDYSPSNDANSVIIKGKVDINPEFVRYKQKDKQEEGKDNTLFKVGFQFSQPFQKASKIIDPAIISQEYIYIDTKFFRFEIGSTKSSVAKMRVDPSSLASGAGGVYGTWWRNTKLPVFNTSGLSQIDANALNAMSPVFILYPTLPNEAGFTTQIFSTGRSIDASMFNGNVSPETLYFGSRGQGYPTQGVNSNKISLFSKRFYGFRAGFSYSPSTAQSGYITKEINGNVRTFANMSGGEVRNYMSFALDYRKQIDKYGIGFALFIGYEMGQATDLKYNYNSNNGAYNSVAVSSNNPYYKRNNLSAVAVGGKFVWKNISLAYSYGYWGNSLLNKYQQTTDGKYQVANQKNTSYYHTIGVGANYGPISAGLTYMRSSMARNKLDAWSVGIDYKLVSLKYLKVIPYFEYVGYKFHSMKYELIKGSGVYYKTIGNNGFVISTGIKMVF